MHQIETKMHKFALYKKNLKNSVNNRLPLMVIDYHVLFLFLGSQINAISFLFELFSNSMSS